MPDNRPCIRLFTACIAFGLLGCSDSPDAYDHEARVEAVLERIADGEIRRFDDAVQILGIELTDEQQQHMAEGTALIGVVPLDGAPLKHPNGVIEMPPGLADEMEAYIDARSAAAGRAAAEFDAVLTFRRYDPDNEVHRRWAQGHLGAIAYFENTDPADATTLDATPMYLDGATPMYLDGATPMHLDDASPGGTETTPPTESAECVVRCELEFNWDYPPQPGTASQSGTCSGNRDFDHHSSELHDTRSCCPGCGATLSHEFGCPPSYDDGERTASNTGCKVGGTEQIRCHWSGGPDVCSGFSVNVKGKDSGGVHTHASAERNPHLIADNEAESSAKGSSRGKKWDLPNSEKIISPSSKAAVGGPTVTCDNNVASAACSVKIGASGVTPGCHATFGVQCQYQLGTQFASQTTDITLESDPGDVELFYPASGDGSNTESVGSKIVEAETRARGKSDWWIAMIARAGSHSNARAWLRSEMMSVSVGDNPEGKTLNLSIDGEMAIYMQCGVGGLPDDPPGDPVCNDGDIRCSNDHGTPMHCEDGEWKPGAPCASGQQCVHTSDCKTGSEALMCIETTGLEQCGPVGSFRCAAQTVERCTSLGNTGPPVWVAQQTCQNPFTCSDGCCAAP